MAVVKPFHAVRYGVDEAGPLEDLIAPPYDVISPVQREELRARSPHNVVRLTLPDEEAEAARLWREWLGTGVLVREEQASVWALVQDYAGPDGVRRTRSGLVASLRVSPYDAGVVLPHERTHRGPKEGRLRLLRAVRAQLEPIFLLHDGPPTGLPEREPDVEVEGARLWRVGDEALAGFEERRLLIADGHHRYETALAFHAEEGTEASAFMLVVLVSTQDPGLTIFPTHRVAEHVELPPAESNGDLAAALRRLEVEPHGFPVVAAYTRAGVSLLRGEPGLLDTELVESFSPQGVTYTPSVDEAVAAVDSGSAHAALLLRPPRIEDVFAVAERGDTMPQKSTYFYPKLVSGLLFHPL